MSSEERHGRPDALGLARALRPLYASRASPEKVAARAARALGECLGGPVRLVLPPSIDIRPHEAAGTAAGAIGTAEHGPADGTGWRIDFAHGAASGHLTGGGPAPETELEAALRSELERLAAYLATLRSIHADIDRLEFRLRSLHQISRTLSIVRDLPETETHIVDFTGEMFFAWWTALYRPRDPATFEARKMRALTGEQDLPTVPTERLAGLIPVGEESEARRVERPPGWLPEQTRAIATLDLGGERLGCLLLGERLTGQIYAEDDIQLLSTVAHSCAIALRNAELLAQLRAKTVLDDLTGLYNRRLFESRLQSELERAERYGRPLGLILLDIDQFKTYNDTYGHMAGDRVLSRIGAVIRANTRNVDLACRYGGEEFAVIAPETSREHAGRLGRRLHEAIRGLEPVTGLQRRITVSAGVACFPEDASEPAQLLEAADRALYRAKADGRDRVVVT